MLGAEIPLDWNTSCRPQQSCATTKKYAPDPTHASSAPGTKDGKVGVIRNLVLDHLSDDAVTHAGAIDSNTILSQLPYKKMLNDMFGGSSANHFDVPYVTRAYEENFMREPMHAGERPCVKGPLCECMFIDVKQPFVAVEFMLPGEKATHVRNLCVVCSRAVTQQLYYDVMFDGHEFQGTIQRFGNMHGEPGPLPVPGRPPSVAMR